MNPNHIPSTNNTSQNASSSVRVPAVPLSAAAKNSLKAAILTSRASTGEPTLDAIDQCFQYGLPRALVVRSVSAFHAKKREYLAALVNMGKATASTTTLPMPMLQHLVDGIVHAVATATASAQAAAAQKNKAMSGTTVTAVTGSAKPMVPNPLGVPVMTTSNVLSASHTKSVVQSTSLSSGTSTMQPSTSQLKLQQSKSVANSTVAAMSTLLQSPPTSAYQKKPAAAAVPPVKPPPVMKAVPPPAPAPVSAADLWRQKMTQEFLTTWEWSKPQSGLFLKTHDGKFIVAPKSLGAVRSRSPALARKVDIESVTIDLVKIEKSDDRADENLEFLHEALALQERLCRVRAAAKEPLGPRQGLKETYDLLVDPMSYRRFKVEPKKEAKQVERTLKKSRGNAADTLIKAHKEFLKAIVSHQNDFIRFHRSKRSEVAKLARSVRDQIDRKEKQKERNDELVERDRLAALKANDMRAYSALLEETKNERLKFLLSKTDEYINQVSNLLSEQRAEETGYDTALDRRSTEGSYFLSAHVKKEQVRQPGILVGGDLKEYQIGGLQWLVSLYNNRLNGILADEMGLGKTIQAIALLAYLMEIKDNKGPFLVVVPLSTLSNWDNEFAKWCPSANVVTYKGNPQQRKDIYRDQVSSGNFNVLLTTYEYIIRDKGSLRKLLWQYCIVDEGHRMKNAQSKFAVTLGTQYNTRYRVLLTGTPLQNSLPELWALLNYLLPSIFNSVETFDQWFNKPFSSFSTGTDNSKSDEMLSSEERMLIIQRLHELLRPFMLRRVKSEVLDQLPEKVEKVLRCELSSWQKFLYRQLSRSLADSGSSGNARGLNNVVMQLRKACNHPYLFLPAGMGYVINEAMIRSSGKFDLLDRMLPKLKAAGHRILLFTQMVQVISLLEDYFKFRGYMSLRLDGSTTADEREKRMYEYNAPDSPYFVFLLSTRAGGLGLNLATADTVIIFDSDWNPMMDAQAQDRAHRIGQRNDVRVFRLISNSPVEEKILSRATEKLQMNELVVEAGKFDSNDANIDRSLERQQLMKDLLSADFTENGTNQEAVHYQDEIASQSTSDAGDINENEDTEENLNEMMSTNNDDFDLYHQMDEIWASTGVKKGIYKDDCSIPDWIRFPKGKKPIMTTSEVVTGGREKKKVMYDDGLTEKQFLKLMENGGPPIPPEASEPVVVAQEVRPTTNSVSNDFFSELAPKPVSSRSKKNQDIPPDALPHEIINKLINTTKAIIYYKEAQTKRRLAEVFLERPSPQMYPDYYRIIKEPIGMNDILRKCRARLFTEVKQWFDSWRLLFNNARKYNPEGSWVVNDANTLETELDRITGKNGLAAMLPKPAPKPLRIKLSLKRLQKPDSTSEPKAKKAKSSMLSTISSTMAQSSDNLTPISSSYGGNTTRIDAAQVLSLQPSVVDDIYSDVVGIEHRDTSAKKRGKVSVIIVGKGDKGEKGSHKKRGKKSVETV